MKLKLLWAVFSFPLFAFGQGYTPLLQKENQWNTIEEVVDRGSVTSRHFNQSVYKLQNDTLINGVTYHIVVESTDSLQTWTTAGFLREDTEGKKVYQWLEDKEILLYDFTLEVGDSIFFPDTEFKSVVDEVDSIKIGGIMRKAIYYTDEDYRADCWIEGVGCNLIGILRTYRKHTDKQLFYYNNSLVIDEELIYVDQSLLSFFTDFWGVKNQPDQEPYPPDPIDPPTSNEDVPIQNDIKFYITSGELTIESREQSTVRIYNSSGLILHSRTKQRVHTFSLSPGIYFVSINENKYKIYIN